MIIAVYKDVTNHNKMLGTAGAECICSCFRIHHFPLVFDLFVTFMCTFWQMHYYYYHHEDKFFAGRTPPITLLTEAVIGWPLGIVSLLSCTCIVILMTATSDVVLYFEFLALLLLRYFTFSTNAVFLVST